MQSITKRDARRLWLRAQKLDTRTPFGQGTRAAQDAIEHLGYVQIDTIAVIERCHHHILYTRIPEYDRSYIRQLQAVEKTIFEYWTHALALVPVSDFRFFISAMKRQRSAPISWFQSVTKEDLRKVMNLVRKTGALSIRDIDDDVLVEKDHAWASRKPSRKALQFAFHAGLLTINERDGMLKSYDLTERHFNWERWPKAATETEIVAYLLDRALRSQGIVSLDSICHLDAKRKPKVLRLIEQRLSRRELLPVAIEGCDKVQHWARPEVLTNYSEPAGELVHILSPFDPLTIQRKRLELLFDYKHVFEAYVPKEKRMFGYFALPVLVGDEIVAVIDLKADRQHRKLLLQQWTWLTKNHQRQLKKLIEEDLHRFERFQFALPPQH